MSPALAATMYPVLLLTSPPTIEPVLPERATRGGLMRAKFSCRDAGQCSFSSIG